MYTPTLKYPRRNEEVERSTDPTKTSKTGEAVTMVRNSEASFSELIVQAEQEEEEQVMVDPVKTVQTPVRQSKPRPTQAREGRREKARTLSVSPYVQKAKEQQARLATSWSTPDLSDVGEEQQARNLPATESTKRSSYSQATEASNTGMMSYSSIPGGSRRHKSTSSTSSLTTLPLVSVPSLKSPDDGDRVLPWPRPKEVCYIPLEC